MKPTLRFLLLLSLLSIPTLANSQTVLYCSAELATGILKKDGKWIIVDLGKPDDSIARFGVSFYLKIILPIIAYRAGGKLGLKFATLYGTYKLWPKNKKRPPFLK